MYTQAYFHICLFSFPFLSITYSHPCAFQYTGFIDLPLLVPSMQELEWWLSCMWGHYSTDPYPVSYWLNPCFSHLVYLGKRHNSHVCLSWTDEFYQCIICIPCGLGPYCIISMGLNYAHDKFFWFFLF